MDKRQLLEECADLYVVCDDSTRIACSRFHVSSRCNVLRWVTEDTLAVKEIPFPGIPSENLRLALDVIHDLATLEDYSLDEIDAADRGFDVLGADVDTTARVWELMLLPTTTIHTLHRRLARLMRSAHVSRDLIIERAVKLAPMFCDVLDTVRWCEPDARMGAYLAYTLAKFYPVAALVKFIIGVVPSPTLDQALKIAGCDGVGTYAHPREVAQITEFLKEAYSSVQSETWNFIRFVSGALHTYDGAPLSSSAFNGSVIMFHDSQSTSTMLQLDGTLPARRVVLAKWLKLSMTPTTVATIRAHDIDYASKTARFLDVRFYVEAGSQALTAGAELWHSWSGPQWIPTMTVSTDACPKITGDPQVFASVVDAGRFAKKLSLRIDIFYGATSALANPPLF